MSTVVVAREFDEFSRLLVSCGVKVINSPVIETRETSAAGNLREIIEKGDYDGIFVTSAVAASILLREVFTSETTFAGRVYVFGRKSHALLADKVLRLRFFEKAVTAAEMLASIPPEELANGRFLFVRGDRSQGAIGSFLNGVAELDEIVVYETRQILISAEDRQNLSRCSPDAVCLFSPSGAESFIGQIGAGFLKSTKVAAIGRTTAAYLEENGFPVAFVSPSPTAADFAEGLLKECLELRRQTA